MAWQIDITTIFLGLLAIIYLALQWHYSYWYRKGFKYFSCFGFLMYCYKVFIRKKALHEVLNDIYRSTNEPFIGVFALYRPALIIRDPALIRQIIVKDFAYFGDRGFHSNEDYDPLSGNLICLPAEKWKKIRGQLSPTFTPGKLKTMFPSIQECGTTLQEYLNDRMDNGELHDVHEIAASYSTKVIASVAFGIDADAIRDPNNEFRVIGRKLFELTFMNAWRQFLVFAAPKVLNLFRIKSFDQSIEDFIFSVVKQNMEYREKNNIVRKDLFQLLIQMKKSKAVESNAQCDNPINADESEKALSVAEICAQIFVYWAAGFETSSGTITFCLNELAANADIQKRVHDEIDEVLEKHDGQVTYESISDMKYLDTCIDETLRKYSIVPVLPRNCLQEYLIPGTNSIIPKGTFVVILLPGLHLDEKYYPEPMKFNPDRFSEENSLGKDQLNRPYYPFGDGPRNCIAMRMGKLLTKVAIVSMLQKFRFELKDQSNSEIKFNPNAIFLTPREKINLRIFKR